MDNTWATPLFYDSHAHGVDLSIQAGTKYYAGHSDVLIGTVSARTPELYSSCARPGSFWASSSRPRMRS